jgi:flagellar biosynthesis regulator FlbT
MHDIRIQATPYRNMHGHVMEVHRKVRIELGNASTWKLLSSATLLNNVSSSLRRLLMVLSPSLLRPQTAET